MAEVDRVAWIDDGTGGSDDVDVSTTEFITDFSKGALWEKFLEVCRDDVTKATKKGSLPLYAAIHLCHQWNPVIESIWKEDPSVSESIDPNLELPPFLVAASTTHNRHYCPDLGEYKLNIKINNSFNTTYALLRANPTMFTFRTPSSNSKEEEGNRKCPTSADTKKKGHKKQKSSAWACILQ